MNVYKLNKGGCEHIGKRYANGFWCWDCKVRATRDELGNFWYCKKCGQRTSDKTLFNPAFRELGFDKSKEIKRTGINGASGFIWQAKDKKDALKKIGGLKRVKTEYGEYWTIKRFWRMFDDVIIEEYSDCDFS